MQSMGQRERYIMREARLIMEDHKAISITLTSTLKHAFPPYSKCTQWNRPASELVSFISRLSSHPFYFWPTCSTGDHSSRHLRDDHHFSLLPCWLTPCGCRVSGVAARHATAFLSFDSLNSTTEPSLQIRQNIFEIVWNFRGSEHLFRTLSSASKKHIHPWSTFNEPSYLTEEANILFTVERRVVLVCNKKSKLY